MQTSAKVPARWHTGGFLLLGMAALLALYAVGYDQGQILSFSLGDLSYQLNLVHEFFHDARHAAGLACH